MSDADDKSVPFARRQAQWGRPPQTTFIAGPLPRGTGLMPPVASAPKTEAPKAQALGGETARPAPRAPAAGPGHAFGGSLVPQRRATPPAAAPTFLTAPMPGLATPPRPAPSLAPVAPTLTSAAVETAKSAPVDATPRPLPPVQAPVEPVVAKTPRAVSHEDAPRPVASRPDPVVRAAAAPASAPVTPRKTANRLPLYIAAAAVVVIGAPVVTWLITRSNSEPAPAAPSPVLEASGAAVSVPPVVENAGTVAAETPVAAAPPPAPSPVAPRPAVVRRAPAAASTQGRTTDRSSSAPTTAVAAPSVVAPASPPPVVVVAPAPETSPPAAPPPTAARPAQSDPDAPVVTKPQPLD